MIRNHNVVLLMVLAVGVNHPEMYADPTPASAWGLPTDARIVMDTERGTVRSMSAANLSAQLERDDAFLAWQAAGQDGRVAAAFLASIAPLLKLQDIDTELQETSSTKDDIGMAHVSFSQTYQGIPVWNCQVRVHLDRSRHVTSVEASVVPTPMGISLEPKVSEAQALVNAAQHLGMPECARCRVQNVIWPGDAGRAPRLTYVIWASKTLREKWQVILDAQTGEIMEKQPTTPSSSR